MCKQPKENITSSLGLSQTAVHGFHQVWHGSSWLVGEAIRASPLYQIATINRVFSLEVLFGLWESSASSFLGESLFTDEMATWIATVIFVASTVGLIIPKGEYSHKNTENNENEYSQRRLDLPVYRHKLYEREASHN
jgi:hypothetical protein